MADQAHDRFEPPPEMRSVAESSFKQAREAFEKLLADAETATGSLEERGASMRAGAEDVGAKDVGAKDVDAKDFGAKDVGAKTIDFAEANVQSSLDYAQSLVHAKDLSEVTRLHREYVQALMRTLAEQASEMGRIVGRAAMDATRPKSK
ncbi:phasin family protein [Bradyrhizobium sp. 186]|uniref:phasin family protein n=1 Tax=Bradyrhizobium sp. 186 TaxID=2782654 RepID=UPI002001D238|nr:phasin family protein [Bradyrhizobium sp. 186]UPK34690.1 phasin family protein [Bradyrhizobium sp. 186]